tara:strand:- start:831 stop:1034 length:204 start_codon:yes stop_codon:yes gene_type:complete
MIRPTKFINDLVAKGKARGYEYDEKTQVFSKGVFTVELGLVHGLESMHGVDAFSEIEKGLADRATEA